MVRTHDARCRYAVAIIAAETGINISLQEAYGLGLDLVGLVYDTYILGVCKVPHDCFQYS